MAQHTVLVVEDDEFLMDAYKVKLAQSNYEILAATDGESGLKLATEKKPEVIVLDLVLPNMSGLEVLKALKSQEETKKIPVIVASNLDQKETIEEAQGLGADDYFIKSNISINELVDKIQRYLPSP